MALYQYRCLGCEHEFSRAETLTEHGKSKVTCPKCRSDKIERVFTPFYAKTVRKS